MDIGNLIVGFSVIQALLLVAFLLGARKISFPRLPLVLLLLALLYFQLEFLLVRNAISLEYKNLLLTHHGGWLLVGPLIWYYTASFHQGLSWQRLLIHLTPFLLAAIVFPALALDTIPKRGVDYSMLTVFKYPDMGLTTINATYGVIFMLQFVHLGAYIAYSWRYAYQHEQPDQPFLKRSIQAISLLYLMVLVFYGIFVTQFYYRREWDYLIVVPFAILIYYVVYAHLRHPEWFRTDIRLRKSDKYEKSQLSAVEIEAVMRDLTQLMQTEQAFKNPELNLDRVAQQLGYSRHTISQSVNSSQQLSFNAFLNRFRVHEAQRLIRENGGASLLQIAHQSGFSNKATFNKYFKLFTGLTPSEYKDKAKADTLSQSFN